jgi:hypothetical protein
MERKRKAPKYFLKPILNILKDLFLQICGGVEGYLGKSSGLI